VAIHGHNLDHNGYLYLPFDQTAMANGANIELLTNALQVVANSKAKITQAPAPAITLEYKDMNTNVTITPSRNLPKTRLFYTTDGTEPTEASAEYTDVINLTSATTVKAVAIAEGYLLSDVTEQEIVIKSQPKTPQISYEESDGFTTITITSESEDAEVWYNFNETTDTITPISPTRSTIISKFSFVSLTGNSPNLANSFWFLNGFQIKSSYVASYNSGFFAVLLFRVLRYDLLFLKYDFKWVKINALLFVFELKFFLADFFLKRYHLNLLLNSVHFTMI
jgi:hypothetical protein